MSTSPITQTIEMLSREKGIEPQVIISAIEDAVVSAARKQFKTTEDLRARFNNDTGDVELFALMTVVEEVQDPATEISLAEVEAYGVEGAEVGDQLEFPKSREELGRIAAQTAKQIIFQKVREAERNNVYEEYINRLGELIHGFVKRFEGGRIVVDLGKIEAILPKTEQSRAESFTQGERIRVVINDVNKDSKGPQVEVSRTSPELLKRLFEMEVPEIYDGTVQIKAAVREPGDRAKIAVVSTERDVDPVGACVGMKGSRVQAIIRELRGERIDIIEWNEDPAVFAANALSPAKVSKVEINSFEEKHLTVTVPEDQLSLAIGKRGQNVRLAAKLVGWHVDIRSAEEAARAAAAQLEAVMAGGEASLADIRESLALDQITAQRLKDRGVETIERLAEMSVDELVDAIDVSFDQANEIIERSRRLLAQKRLRESRLPLQAEEISPEAEDSTAIDVEASAEGESSDQGEGEAEAQTETSAEALSTEPVAALTDEEATAEPESSESEPADVASDGAVEAPATAESSQIEGDSSSEETSEAVAEADPETGSSSDNAEVSAAGPIDEEEVDEAAAASSETPDIGTTTEDDEVEPAVEPSETAQADDAGTEETRREEESESKPE